MTIFGRETNQKKELRNITFIFLILICTWWPHISNTTITSEPNNSQSEIKPILRVVNLQVCLGFPLARTCKSKLLCCKFTSESAWRLDTIKTSIKNNQLRATVKLFIAQYSVVSDSEKIFRGLRSFDEPIFSRWNVIFVVPSELYYPPMLLCVTSWTSSQQFTNKFYEPFQIDFSMILISNTLHWQTGWCYVEVMDDWDPWK